jgi:phosphatidylinositol 4-kinase
MPGRIVRNVAVHVDSSNAVGSCRDLNRVTPAEAPDHRVLLSDIDQPLEEVEYPAFLESMQEMEQRVIGQYWQSLRGSETSSSAVADFALQKGSISTVAMAMSRPNPPQNLRLRAVIIKANDDLRQEHFASTLIREMGNILSEENVSVILKPYEVLPVGSDGGIIEAVRDSISIDALKRSDPNFSSLSSWFERHYNRPPRGRERLAAAQMNFCRSLAAQSIITYILRVTDRHSGNLLLTTDGCLVHIDWGFFLTSSPGQIGFEMAPFKLSTELVGVLGGSQSPLFTKFRTLCRKTFQALRKHRERIYLFVEMVLQSHPELPAFRGGALAVMEGLKRRFFEGMSEERATDNVDVLVDQALASWTTSFYDTYQRWMGYNL